MCLHAKLLKIIFTRDVPYTQKRIYIVSVWLLRLYKSGLCAKWITLHFYHIIHYNTHFLVYYLVKLLERLLYNCYQLITVNLVHYPCTDLMGCK